MKTQTQLPPGYRPILSVDLQKDKKLALLVNLAALILALLTVLPALFLRPIGPLFDLSRGVGPYALRFAAIFAGMFVYILGHEAVHGVAMKLCGSQKVRYGFTGLYAFAGSEDYYGKKSYLFIALAPIVFWGLVLGALCAAVPEEWFWVVYIVQVMNISGAAGDLYVTLRFLRLPKDILVQDSGVSMTVFSAQ